MSALVCKRVASRVRPLALAACFLAAPLQADPPASVTYTYDHLGRLRTGSFGDGRAIDYQYDPAGNRMSMLSGFTVQLSIAAASSVAEGSSLIFPVTKTGTSEQTITVQCVPQNDTAQVAPSGAAPPLDDYVTTPQTVTFLASDPSPMTKNCAIATKTDSYYEGTQTLNVHLQNSVGAVITLPGVAPGSILDTNAPPNFTVLPPLSSVGEGGSMQFTIARNGFSELQHSVHYSTADGTATIADNDYTAVGPTLITIPPTFFANQVQVPVNIATTADGKFESAETLSIVLSAPGSPATLGSPSSMTGTMNNDDMAPTVAINDPPAVSEGQARTFNITLTGNTNTAFSHNVSWTTANGTATAGSDYTAASGTVTLSTGDTQETVSVQTLTDGVYEPGAGGTENFAVNISTNANSNGAVISFTDPSGNGVIFDMDNPFPSQPEMTSPAFRQDPDGNYGVDWTDSSGPLGYYVLEESGGGGWSPIQVTPSFYQFNNKGSAEYFYRVKACTSGGACSGYSSTIQVNSCSPQCP
jgi:hypothetical protein